MVFVFKLRLECDKWHGTFTDDSGPRPQFNISSNRLCSRLCSSIWGGSPVLGGMSVSPTPIDLEDLGF